jgi:hypothetical protein
MTTSAPAPVDTCIAQAFVQVQKVEYQGRENGHDKVYVEWKNQSTSPCVWFGSGFDVPGKADIPPFGQEVTVKIKRRLGNEDSGSSKSTIITSGSQVVTDVINIPRATLETDPVSYEVKVRTTAGSVTSETARVAGNGVPSLSGASQTFIRHSSLPNTASPCFPTLQVSALNFFPGAGPKPDRVTINWAAGSTPSAACFDPPKVSIIVRATRPTGVVDSGQGNFDAGITSSTISLPGTPGKVGSFEVLVTASMGSVIEKISNRSGPF